MQIYLSEINCFMRKRFSSNRTGLGHQYDRRFLGLGHHMVDMTSMWKLSIGCYTGLWLPSNRLCYRIYSNKRPTSKKRPCQRQKKLISAQPRISAHPTPLPPTQTQIRHNKRPSRRRSFLQSILQIGLKPCFVTSSLFVITIYYFVAK